MTDDEPDILDRLGIIHRSLDAAGVDHAVGGALALAHHVYPPRGTVDIDLNVLADADDPHPVFAALPDAIELPLDAADQVRRTGQIRLWWRGALSTPVDLFFPQHPTFHRMVIERAQPADFLGETIKVLTPGDLMVFKMLFGRRKDWADIEELIRSGADTTEPASWVATFVGPNDHQLTMLAEVIEEVAGEAR